MVGAPRVPMGHPETDAITPAADDNAVVPDGVGQWVQIVWSLWDARRRSPLNWLNPCEKLDQLTAVIG
jgi:hypothetical protein